MVLGRRLVVDNDYPHSNPKNVVDAFSVDNCWADFKRAAGSEDDGIIFDFGETKYLSHDSLLHIAGLLSFRHYRNLTTQFELPRTDRVWQYLRAWRFPQMVETITGREFPESLTSDSKTKYFRDTSETPVYVRAIVLPGGGDAELLPQRHFTITPIRLDENPLRAATWIKDQWMEKHLLSVLDAYLENEGERVGSLVVLEAVLNAAMHPKAKSAYISSQIVMSLDETVGDAQSMEISVWDDGVAIADTLRMRLQNGLQITSDAYGTVDETFQVRLVRSGRDEFLQTVGPDIDELDPHFPWLTVAAFIVGVTASPERTLTEEQQARFDDIEKLFGSAPSHAGRGLHYIRRNVLNLWHGELRYSSGHYRLHMRAAEQENTYSVTIQYRPGDAWPLRGNNLTMHIPLGRTPANGS